MTNESSKHDSSNEQTNDDVRKVYLLIFIMSIILLTLLIIFGFVLPTSNYNTMSEITSNGAFGLAYFILVGTGLLLLVLAFCIGLLIPLLIFSRKLVKDSRQKFTNLNEERLRPITRKGKIKKIISDLSLIIGICLFIASQVILYGFIYY